MVWASDLRITTRKALIPVLCMFFFVRTFLKYQWYAYCASFCLDQIVDCIVVFSNTKTPRPMNSYTETFEADAINFFIRHPVEMNWLRNFQAQPEFKYMKSGKQGYRDARKIFLVCCLFFLIAAQFLMYVFRTISCRTCQRYVHNMNNNNNNNILHLYISYRRSSHTHKLTYKSQN